jgi:nitrogen regulatory protein PII
MVLIEAVIKPFKLDDLKEALEELGVGGMTVTEVMQTAAPRAGRRSADATAIDRDMVPKIKVEIAAARNMAERVIEAICLYGSAGKSEDGKVVIEQVEGTVRIRTGDLDADALS